MKIHFLAEATGSMTYVDITTCKYSMLLLFYGCRESTTKPDQRLVVPVQVTEVLLA